MNSKEEIIINQLKAGSEQAYKYLYDTYYVSLCYVANKYLDDHYQSEMIVGDTIFHLWEIRDRLHIETSLLAYLIGAVRNRCFNYQALASTRYEVPVSYLSYEEDADVAVFDYATSRDHALNGLLAKELGGKIQEAIGTLSPECRAVFEKSRFEKMKYEDISQELNISVNTVKYHIKSALRLLRDQLGKYIAFLIIFFH